MSLTKLSSLWLAAAVAAQSPRLLLDINTAPRPALGSAPRDFAWFGNTALFSAGAPGSGLELYRTDGTRAGTQFVRDLEPGPRSSLPSGFVTLGADTLCIAMREGQAHLFRTDGTAAGTVPLVDLGVGYAPALAVMQLGTRACFLLGFVDGTQHLVITDGTVAGTQVLASLQGGYASHAVLGNRAFVVGGRELWVTDGTAAGTLVLAQADPTARLAVAQNAVWFGGISTIWRTDGTLAGTQQAVATFAWGGCVALGNRLSFTDGTALYVSDGTPAGTQSIATFAAVQAAPMLVANGRLFFAAADAQSGSELWSSDGTAAGTRLVADLNPGAGSTSFEALWPFGSRIAFSAATPSTGAELGFSDGSPAGTRLLDLEPGVGSSFPRAFAADPSGGRALLQVHTRAVGVELWSTDGTVSGTQLLADLATSPPPTESASPGRFADLGGRLLFFATDVSHGREPWLTDGSTAGTRLLVDLVPGSGSSSMVPSLEETVATGGRAFFAADAGAGTQLWSSDGTAAGTRAVSSVAPRDFAVLDERRVVFAGRPSGSVRDGELHVSDGTAAGTFAIDVAPGPLGSAPHGFVRLGNRLVFSAFHPSFGREPWITDGTVAGTRLLADLVPGPDGSHPDLVALGDAVWLRVGVASAAGLWRTDGTTAGTTRTVALPDLGRLFAARGLLFFARDDGTHGTEPWVSDGTVGGTRLLRDLFPGAESSYPIEFVEVDRGVLIATRADPVSRYGSLWITEGTAASTSLVTTVAAERVRAVGSGFAVFTAGDGIWQTDGSAAGTRLLVSASILNFDIAMVGNHLLGAFEDGIHGEELWHLDEAARATAAGLGCGSATRIPSLRATDPVLGASLDFALRHARGDAVGVVLLGGETARPASLLAGCALHVDPAQLVAVLPTSVGGAVRVAQLPLPRDVRLAGLSALAQAAALPGDTPLGLDLSNAVRLTLGLR